MIHILMILGLCPLPSIEVSIHSANLCCYRINNTVYIREGIWNGSEIDNYIKTNNLNTLTVKLIGSGIKTTLIVHDKNQN